MTVWDRGVSRGVVGLTPRPNLECGGKRPRDAALDQLQNEFVLTHPKRRRRFALPAHSKTARVPGVGLLNRTRKSWVERHEVQPVR